MKTKRLFLFLITFTLIAVIFSAPFTVQAAQTNGVNDLRGLWNGVIKDLYGGAPTFQLQLDRSGPAPNDPLVFLYNGCMALGEGKAFAPISARVMIAGNGKYDLTLLGTAASGGFIIKLTGLIKTFGSAVTDDTAGGVWQTADQQGNWSASHHDRRQVKCPAVTLGNGLWFSGDTYAGANVDSTGNIGGNTLLESYTNIVSFGMQVVSPDNQIVIVPPFTDVFSPQINFNDNFRYLHVYDGFPIPKGVYKFSLLDVFGQPIPGATAKDVWSGCMQDAPRNVVASVGTNGIQVNWDSVSPVPGFNPQGTPSVGFYQIGLNLDNGGNTEYGAAQMHTASHLIPFAGFGSFAPGNPDGFDFGSGLLDLVDGNYVFEVVAFSEPPAGSGGVGLECQIRAENENVYFEKNGATFTSLP